MKARAPIKGSGGASVLGLKDPPERIVNPRSENRSVWDFPRRKEHATEDEYLRMHALCLRTRGDHYLGVAGTHFRQAVVFLWLAKGHYLCWLETVSIRHVAAVRRGLGLAGFQLSKAHTSEFRPQRDSNGAVAAPKITAPATRRIK